MSESFLNITKLGCVVIVCYTYTMLYIPFHHSTKDAIWLNCPDAEFPQRLTGAHNATTVRASGFSLAEIHRCDPKNLEEFHRFLLRLSVVITGS